MNPDFIFILSDRSTIKVYDNSQISQSLSSIPLYILNNQQPNSVSIGSSEINSFLLDIESDVLPNGRIDAPKNVLDYIHNRRESNELFKITPEELGLTNTTDIPDGVYTITIRINNIYVKTYNIVIYQQIKSTVDELLTKFNYGVDIGNYDVTYVGDYADEDVERLSIARGFLDNIQKNAFNGGITEVKDSITKLQKLLTLIKKV